jgi:hypothetical protein
MFEQTHAPGSVAPFAGCRTRREVACGLLSEGVRLLGSDSDVDHEDAIEYVTDALNLLKEGA